jgi:hypothetical protein
MLRGHSGVRPLRRDCGVRTTVTNNRSTTHARHAACSTACGASIVRRASRGACGVQRAAQTACGACGTRSAAALLRTACSNCSVREARAACGECGVNPVKCAAHAARGVWRAACGLRRQPCGEWRVLRVQRAARAARDVRSLLRAVLEHAACGVRCGRQWAAVGACGVRRMRPSVRRLRRVRLRQQEAAHGVSGQPLAAMSKERADV